MKKIVAALLALLVLGGCGGSLTQKDVTDKYTDAHVKCSARIETLSETASEYTVLFEGSGEGGEVEIIAPESIKGVKASVGAGGAEIEYEGKSVYTFLPAYRETAPVSCLCSLFEAIVSKKPSAFSPSARRLDYTEGRLARSLYFDEDLLLKSAEILYDGVMIVRVEITGLTLE